MNPLFPNDPDDEQETNSYLLARSDKYHVKPLSHTDNPAVQMIRHKIDAMYAHEPSAREEIAEVEQAAPPLSKHQTYMRHLLGSGRSMAEIQTAWHHYYLRLPDHEKHEVWQEFYRANAAHRGQTITHRAAPSAASPQPVVIHHQTPTATTHKTDRRTVASVKRDVLKRVRLSHSAQQKAHQSLKSLMFGISLGALTLLIALFGLFNELVIAPFIRPGNANATPIILNADAPAPSAAPELIIPKLNAQLPVVYTGQSLAESEVQKALEDGVFHYPTTAAPGQNGNVAIFGHSSNNILNKGKYKFAFVLLHELAPGDIFYLTFNGKVYSYKVYTKKVVNPDETWVLGPVQDKLATVALITCDPPGTTRHRLVVWGEQVSPNPSSNNAAAQPSQALQTQSLAGNGPSAWSRLVDWLNPF